MKYILIEHFHIVILNNKYNRKWGINIKQFKNTQLKIKKLLKVNETFHINHIYLVSKNSFQFLSIIGRGGFGKVWRVSNHKYKSEYAMKEMSKKRIIDKNSIKSILYERDLLSKMNHSFIVNMHFAFQDVDTLYLVMDLLSGGDLRYHLCFHKHFTEEQCKFIIACIILGLEYLHASKIIHRDIKPENLIMDSKGYVKITDFGVAKIYEENNKTDTSGTPGYMAPEVICGQNHTEAVDYFALGVIAYEIMLGRRPYLGRNRKEIKDKMISSQIQITQEDKPADWSVESIDFINKLLMRKPSKRLGYTNGIQEIKAHKWFKFYNWKDLYLGKLEAPFKPSEKLEDNFDFSYCNAEEKIGIFTQARYNSIEHHEKYPKAFVNYEYFNRHIMLDKFQHLLYTNPHQIYEELEAKERLAFDFHDDKDKKFRKRKVKSMNEKGLKKLLINTGIGNGMINEEEGSKKKKEESNDKK